MPEPARKRRAGQRLYEFDCFVSANISRSAAAADGFPAKGEQRIDRLFTLLESDATVVGQACCTTRAMKSNRPPGYDASFTVIASGIMAASVTATCAFRNALDRLGLEVLDVSHVEVTRTRFGGRRADAIRRAVAV